MYVYRYECVCVHECMHMCVLIDKSWDNIRGEFQDPSGIFPPSWLSVEIQELWAID